MAATELPRARFRDLPATSSADDWVETSDVSTHPTDSDRERRETLTETARAVHLGGPLP